MSHVLCYFSSISISIQLSHISVSEHQTSSSISYLDHQRSIVCSGDGYMRMERRRSSLTPCWPRLEAGDSRLEVEEPIFQLEQVSVTREPAARDQDQDQDTSLPHHHWQRWRPRQVSTRSKCIILSYKRAGRLIRIFTAKLHQHLHYPGCRGAAARLDLPAAAVGG